MSFLKLGASIGNFEVILRKISPLHSLLSLPHLLDILNRNANRNMKNAVPKTTIIRPILTDG